MYIYAHHQYEDKNQIYPSRSSQADTYYRQRSISYLVHHDDDDMMMRGHSSLIHQQDISSSSHHHQLLQLLVIGAIMYAYNLGVSPPVGAIPSVSPPVITSLQQCNNS